MIFLPSHFEGNKAHIASLLSPNPLTSSFTHLESHAKLRELYLYRVDSKAIIAKHPDKASQMHSKWNQVIKHVWQLKIS